MYQAKDGKKYGSVYVGKRKDAEHAKSEGQMPKEDTDYTAGAQPGESNENEHSTPQEAGSSTSEVAAAHGAAHQVTYKLDHEGGESKVKSFHPDGHEHESAYKSPAEAFQAGGELQASDVKRRTHPDQQGASSEGDNDLVPQHEAADLV